MLNDILHYVYLKGYVGYQYPRCIRKIVGGSKLHRAWLSGYMGIFEEIDSSGHTVRRSITGQFYRVNQQSSI